MATTITERGKLVTMIDGMHAKHVSDLMRRVIKYHRKNRHRFRKAARRLEEWIVK